LNCCTTGEEETLLGDEYLFTGNTEERVIDVYWLFDDGGLTLLLPYLLTLRKYWSKAKIRLFTPGREDQLERDQINVTALCPKFRIETSDVSILTTLNQKPTEESRARFKQLIEPFRVRSETSSKIVDQEDQPPEGNTNPNPTLNENDIDDDCVEKFAKKTNRQLRINELIREHSHKSDLVCVTLPMVRVGSCPAALYMAWLDSISFNLPPVLMLRGNQESVLTFYS
jgi:solute carrier family 12 sodium/potassium/chloride transporter 2